MICNVPVCDSDIDKPIVIVPTSNTVGKEYVGTSQTDKPTGVQQYSIYHELDTGKNYYYDNGQWNEIPCCSGGGGGGETITWLIEDVAVEAEYNAVYDAEGALFDFSDVLDEATFVSTFSGKTLVSVLNGVKVEAPGYVTHDDDYPEYDAVKILVGFDDGGAAFSVLLQKSDMGGFIYATAGATVTWSLGIVEE